MQSINKRALIALPTHAPYNIVQYFINSRVINKIFINAPSDCAAHREKNSPPSSENRRRDGVVCMCIEKKKSVRDQLKF